MFVYQEENSGSLFGWAGDYCLISRIRLWSFRSDHIRSPFQVHCWRSPFTMNLWSGSSVRTSVRVFNLLGAVLESFMLQSREHCRRWWNSWPFLPHGTFMYIYGHFICCLRGAVYNPQKVTSGGAACSRPQGMCSELMPTVCRVWGQHISRRVILLFCCFFFPLTLFQPKFSVRLLQMVTVGVKHLVIISVRCEFTSLCG